MQKCAITPRAGNVAKHRKEKNFIYSFTLLAPPEKGDKYSPVARVLMELRIYGTQAANYAALWVKQGDSWPAGSGRATGCGYHRASAAAQNAFDDAGLVLAEPIDGRGDAAMREALMAVGVALGFKLNQLQVIAAHG